MFKSFPAVAEINKKAIFVARCVVLSVTGARIPQLQKMLAALVFPMNKHSTVLNN